MPRPPCHFAHRRLSFQFFNWALIYFAACTAGLSPCRAEGQHHPSGGMQGQFSQGFTPSGGFSQNVGLPAPGPIIHDPNFGSPFRNEPFTMGEILRRQGQLPPISTSPSYNSASCLSLPSPVGQPFVGPGPVNRGGWLNYNLGTLGIVSPGWAGFPYYSPYGNYGYSTFGYQPSIYPSWGYQGFYSPFAYSGYGLPYGWVPFWVQPVNRMVLNYGLIFSVAEIVNRGNSRFGPTRPLRELRNRNQNQNNGGIIMPGAGPAAAKPAPGLNAVAPVAMRQPVMPPRPLDPLNADLNQPPRPVGEKLEVAPDEAKADMAMRVAGLRVAPSRDRVVGIRRSGEAEKSGKNGVNNLDTGIYRLLQGPDRLARNGLVDEARNRYQALAERLQNAPEPWFRLAQLEVIAGRDQAATEAWNKACALAGESSAGYTKQLKWSDIADPATRAEALERLDLWSGAGSGEALAGLRATISPGTAIR